MTFSAIIRSKRQGAFLIRFRLAVLTLVSVLVFSSGAVYAQDCNTVAYDPGGASGNYPNDSDVIQTFTAPSGQVLRISFASFDLETNYDYLRIYDGPNTSSPQIANLTGSTLPNDVVSSGSEITVRFQSDYSVVREGYEFSISCEGSTCDDLYRFDWFDGTNGAVWPIGNGEPSITRVFPISGSTDLYNVTVTMNNAAGQSIDFSNCGLGNHHAYTSTCNDPNGTQDCNTPNENDTQFSYGCTYLTIGMTSDNSNQVVSVTYEFDVPTRISDFEIGDIDYRGSAGTSLESYQDEVEIVADSNGIAMPITATAGMYVDIEGNNSTLLRLLADYASTGSGDLTPDDPNGHAYISTEGQVTTITFSYSNGPADDGPSDDHAIRIQGFNFCPKKEICGNSEDDDLDGYVDDFDMECPNYAPFDCDKTLYQSMAASISADYFINEINLDPISFTPVLNLSTNGMNASGFNSLAFNPVDKFLYGFNPYSSGNSELYMINANGSVQLVGNITGLTGENEAGCMDHEGKYYVTGASQRLFEVDLETLQASEISNLGFTANDIAVSPVNGDIYAWDSTNSRLRRVNPSTGAIVQSFPINARFGSIGSLYFNEQGDIIAYGDDTNASGTGQETLLNIDPNTGTVSVIGNGPEANINDGCSCAFGIAMTKSASSSSIQQGSTIDYTFTIFNRTGSDLTNITFNDVLPNGMVWTSEPSSIMGLTLGSTNITGSSTANFTITNLPPGESNSFVLSTVVPADDCSDIYNQSSLTNLPDGYGTIVLSDDPETPEILDPTFTEVYGCAEDFFLEAECGNVGANWNVFDDSNASNGKYVTINSGNSYNQAPSSIDDRITFNVDVEIAATYNLFARVLGPSGNDDSFWVRANGGTWYKWNTWSPQAASWAWLRVYDSDNSNAFVTFDLVAGANTVDIAYREDGAFLDKIALSVDPGVPTGMGADADNCIEICDNGLDDDGDDLVDCDDPDCANNVNVSLDANNTTICLGSSALITATSTGSLGTLNYSWSHSALESNNSVTVSPSSTTTYIVTVTNAGGCTATDQVSITVNTPPSAGASHDGTLTCSKLEAILTATPSGMSYAWSGGGSNVQKTVTVGGTYTVTVTDGNGCTDVASVVVPTDTTSPTANAGSDDAICLGESTTLTASGGVSYVWSSGSSLSTASVSPAVTTTYTVTVTGSNGCTSTDQVEVVVNTPPSAGASHDGTLTCSKLEAILTATPSGMSYEWSGGGINVQKTVTIGGTYTVTVTDGNGCTDVATVVVPTDTTAPIANAGSDDAICLGESTTLTATGGVSYAWSSGSNVSTASVSPAATTTYTVTVTGSNGCTSTDQVEVVVNTPPSAGASHDGTLTCSKLEAILTATPSGMSYTWSGGGSNVQKTVTVGGTYTVTVTDGNGCTDVATVVVPTDTTAPTANAGSDDAICLGESTTLTATGGVSYAWSSGSNAATASVSPVVTTTYTVTVTGSNGCTSTDQVEVVVNTPPSAGASHDGTLTCSKLEAILTATPSGMSYAWSGGGSNVQKTVTVGGTYTVTVTDGNGCTDVATVVVPTDTTAPIANAGSDDAICLGESTTLTATGGVSYAWSSGSNVSTASVSPAATTTYTVTVTGSNGCTSTDQVEVVVNTPPSAGASHDGTLTCSKLEAILTATPSGMSYAWSGGGSNVQKTVTVGGTYTVTVTDGNGCTDVASVVVPTDTTAPTANAGSDDAICLGESTTLTATGGVSYAWSSGSNVVTASVSPAATTTYTVTVTGSNGCTSTDQVEVVVNTPPSAGASHDGTLTCSKLEAILTATPSGMSYTWSGGGNNVQKTVTVGGTYTVTVTDGNGCTDVATVVVPTDTTAPIANAGSDDAICLGESTTLTATGGVSYAWSSGSTVSTASVSPAATTTYTVTVTGSNGCTSTDQVEVVVNTPPSAGASHDGTLTCSKLEAILTATPSGMSYEWSGGGSNVQKTVTVGGTYTVTVTDGNGCTDVATVVVPTDTTAPIANAGSDDAICLGESTTLTATGGVSYAWSSGSNVLTASVSPAATTTYTVTVTGSNGCTSTDQVEIVVNTPPSAGASHDGTLTCSKLEAILTATPSGMSYEWSDGGSNVQKTVTVGGTYTVTVTDGNGCTDVASVVVPTDTTSPIVNAGSDDAICLGESTTLTATGGVSYAWSSGSNVSTASVSPAVTTTYTVTVTGSNGCTSTDQVEVVVNTPPSAGASHDGTLTCSKLEAILTATPSGMSYTWSGGGSNVQKTVTVGGTYTVTVTDGNGCTDVATVVVPTDTTAPTANAGSDDAICLGESTTLTATGGVSYAWSSGSNAATASVSPVVTTTYTVTVTGSNGCTSTDQVEVVVNTPPSAGASHDGTLTCSKLEAILTATPSGMSYEWSGGGINVQKTVTIGGTYTVTVTDGNGCTDVATVVVPTDTTAPIANAGSDDAICLGESTTLTATGGVSYAWSSGSNVSTASVSPAATTTYTVTVTGSNGCTSTDQVEVVVNTPPSAGASHDGTLTCSKLEAILTATPSGMSYTWSGGGSNVQKTVTVGGTYTVTVTDGNGCTDVATVVVPTDTTAPTANAGSDDAICLGESTTLTATGGVSYAWSSGSNAATASVSPVVTTTYTVTVTGSNGCTSTDQVEVVVNTPPSAGASHDGTLTCSKLEAILTATPSGMSYEWSGGGINVQKTVTIGGTYTVTVTDGNGCTDVATVVVPTDTTAPIANAGSDDAICLGESTTLTATGGVSYAWSSGSNVSTASVSPAATTTYTVTVTGSNGCTSTDQVEVVVNTPPSAGASHDGTLTCSKLEAILTATPSGMSYTWSGGGSNVQKTVTVGGTYTVTVTDGNGCTDVATVVVPTDTTAPTANAGSDDAICLGESTTLTATGGVSYAWSSGSNAATASVSPVVTTTYTVTVTGSNGCTSTDQVEVVVNTPPSAGASHDGTLTCSKLEAILTATPSGMSYAWSGGGSNVQKTVTVGGTYTVTVTDGNGCTDVATVVVPTDTTAPIANAGSDDAICLGESTTLTATGGVSYAWSSGSNVSTASVSPAATTTYTVTVTGSNGCTSTDQVEVVVNTPPSAGASHDGTLTCSKLEAILTATPSGMSYAWSGGGSNVQKTVTVGGTYTVTVTDGNGCTDVASVVVPTDTTAPTANAGSDDAICLGESTTLTATGGVSYAWSSGSNVVTASVSPAATTTYTVTVTGSNGCTSTDQVEVVVNTPPSAGASHDGTLTCSKLEAILTATPSGMSYEWSGGGSNVQKTVTVGGTYTVTVTDGNGCTDVASVVVPTDTTAPTANAGSDDAICLGESTTLTATGGVSYAWSSGSNVVTASVSPAATTTYTVTVTGSNGCTSTDQVEVVVNTPPSAGASHDGTLTCSKLEAILTATPSGMSYTWSGGGSNVQKTVTVGGTYTVTVTDGNGCTDVASVVVPTDTTAPIANAGSDDAICLGESTTLTATGGVSYAWSSGSNVLTASVSPAATTTYTVTVTGSNGCTSTDQVEIVVNTPPSAGASHDGTLTCSKLEAILTATPSGMSYEWSDGGSNVQKTVTVGGTYTVTVTDGNGCTDVASVVVPTDTTSPIVNAGSDDAICLGESTTLTATGGVSYAWSSGSNVSTASVSPAVTTTYTVTVTGSNGCTSTDQVEVVVNTPPSAGASHDGTLTCSKLEAILTATPSGMSYAWSGGGSNVQKTVTVGGTYTVTVTDGNGCTDVASVVVPTDTTAPIANAGSDDAICLGESTTLTATGGVSYAWSSGSNVSTASVSPAVTTTYTVTVTGSNGCTSTDQVEVVVNTPPSAGASHDGTLTCSKLEAILTATPSGMSYTWSGGGSNVQKTVTVGGTYTVTVTDGNGCTDVATVVVPTDTTAPIANAGSDDAICLGESTTLTATGGVSYAWSSGSNVSTASVSPAVTTTYTVTVTGSNGCTSTDQVEVVVNTPPSAGASHDGTLTCSKLEAILTATPSGMSYTWSGGGSNEQKTVTVGGTYTVTVTDGNGCTDVATVVVPTDTTAPTANAGSDDAICLGESTTLTATGGVSYAWSSGSNVVTASVSPAATTTYTVTVTGSNGCTSTDQVEVVVNTPPSAGASHDGTLTCSKLEAILTATPSGMSYEWSGGGSNVQKTVTVGGTYTVTVTDGNGCTDVATVVVPTDTTAPIANAGSDDAICLGESTPLTATGGVSYAWNSGSNAATASVSPAVTTTYTVTVTGSNGCTSTDQVEVVVNTPPSAGASHDGTLTCSKLEAILTATPSGMSYTWSGGGNNVQKTVTVGGTYTVTVTDGNGCTDVATVVVPTDTTAPIANAGSDDAICLGESTTLTASGGVSYAWSSGSNVSTASVSPAVTTTYTVTVTGSNGCTSTDQVEVVVNTPPSAGASHDGTLTCSKLEAILTATPSGMSYEWSGGGSNVQKTVTVGGTYTVTVTDGNGCTDVATVVVPTDTTAPIANAGSDDAICLGESTTLTATGGVSYAWSSGSNVSTASVSPAVTTTYTVTVTGSNGCTSTDQVEVVVNTPPSAGASHDGTLTCSKLEAILTATPSGMSYTWSGGGSNVQKTVTVGGTYTVTVSDGNGCTDVATVVVTTDTTAPIANAGSDDAICLGESTTLTATGGVSYAWSSGSNATTASVSPAATTTYTVTVTGSNGCTSTDQVEVVVNTPPSAGASHDGTLTCSKLEAVLTATPSGMSYAWSGGGNNVQKTVTVGGTYTVTVTDGNGCTDVASVVVPTDTTAPTANAGSDDVICLGESTVLTATGGVSYAWSSGSNAVTASVSPVVTTTYTVTVTGSNGCTSTDQVEVVVNTPPSAGASHDGTLTCSKLEAILTATPSGMSYEWSGGGSNVEKTVTIGGTYTVTVTDGNGCTDVATVVVPTDTTAPTANAGSDDAICLGESTTLTATGGVSYAWSSGSNVLTASVSPAVTTTYTVTVTGSNGCTSTDQVEVVVNPIPVVSATNDGPITCAQPNVIMVASPAGLTYDWQGGGNGQTKSISTPGTYVVTITDNNGCVNTATTTVEIDTVTVLASLSHNGIITCDNATVTISVNPSDKSYLWSNGATTNTIDVTVGGIYSVTLTNDNGCQDTSSIYVVQDNIIPSLLVDDQEICAGESIEIIPNVCENYAEIIAQRPLISDGFNNKFGENHSALVGDGEFCFSLESTSSRSLQVLGLNDLPEESDGYLDIDYGFFIEARPGSSNYRLEVRESGTTIVGQDYTQAELENSEYCIRRTGTLIEYFKDGTLFYTSLVASNSNLYYDNSFMSSDNGLYASGYSSFSDISICGILDMSYSWSNGSTTKDITVDQSGDYILLVTDSKGCSAIATSTLVVNPLPAAAISNDGPITCNDEIVTLTALPASMNYEWDNGSTNSSIDVMENGTYFVTVTSAEGCDSIVSTVVTTALPPVVEMIGSDSICIGSLTNLSPNSGGEWTSSNNSVAIISNTGQVVGVSGGTVTFTFVDGVTGCSAISSDVYVSPDMSISLDYIGGVCLTEDSQLGVNITGGTSEYTYSWTGPDGFASSDSLIDVDLSGNYYVTVTDAVGCERQTSGYIYAAYNPFIFSLETEICEGESVNLVVNSGTATSYQWSANAGSATTPEVTVTPGPPSVEYTVTITNEIGCTSEASMTIDVNAKVPVEVTGNATICEGETTQLSPSTGGEWISSNNSMATVTSSGLVTAVSDGTVTFVFRETATGCFSDPTETVTILAKPTINIFGPSTLCEGETTNFLPNSGGVWSSTDESVATITSDGEVTGVGPGTVRFVFEDNTTGCSSDTSSSITIHEVFPVSITGQTDICVGQNTFLSPTTGGTWTSSDESIATVNNIGVVTGVSGGTVTFTFESAYNCTSPASEEITIEDNEIVTITGRDSVCEGDTTMMSTSLPGGTWSSSNNSILTVDSTGLVTTVAEGQATVTYTPAAGVCALIATFDIAVLGKPNATLNGAIDLCVGELSSVTTSQTGGSWTSTDDLVAIVSNEGVVVGINGGTAAFIYQGVNGCYSDTTAYITVNPELTVDVSIIGSQCLEDNTQLTANPTGGSPEIEYAWSGPGGFSSSSRTIDIPLSGVYTVTVSDVAGCSDSESVIIYESYEPFIFTLDTEVCEGEDVSLSVNGSGGGTYQWSANAGGSTSQNVVVTPTVPASTYFVTITNSNGCATVATANIDVNPSPIITITGSDEICEGTTTTLTPSTGGTWSSSDYSVATINNMGQVSGLAPGSVVFTYRDESTGCYSDPSASLTVLPNLSITINGSSDLCVGDSEVFTASEAGGEWQSSNISVATIDATTGALNVVGQGEASITYTISTGCFEIGNKEIVVRNLPTVNINGPSTICEGELTYLLPTSGGSWSSSDEAVATVNAIGVVTALSGGSSTFTFTSDFGCVRELATPITVISNPEVSNSGPSELCLNETTQLVSDVAGIWISSNTLVANVNSSGLVTAYTPGTAEFNFVEFTNGCSIGTPISITVNPNPVINGLDAPNVCIGETTSITPSTNGTWTSTDESIATITDQGIITGISAGAVRFEYLDTLTGCSSQMSEVLTVDGNPSIVINGPTDLCVGDVANIQPESGGTWSSSDVSVATIEDNGEITSVSSGTVNFTFTNTSTGCVSDVSEDFVFNNPDTASISGLTSVCIGNTTQLTGSRAGTWASSNALIGAVDNSGLFTAYAPGVVQITLYTTDDCVMNPTFDILVNPLPTTSFLGSADICIGEETNLSPLTGGTWASSDESVATVSNDGTVLAIGPGEAIFTYTDLTTGCSSTTTQSLDVYGRPDILIAGDDQICIGGTSSMSPSTGGQWVSSDVSIATITSQGSIVGVSPGTVTFTFTESGTGCVSNPSDEITIIDRPVGTISGPSQICIGSTSNLLPDTGGSWMSDNESVAIVSESGIVTGVAQGVARFTFISDEGCLSFPTSPIVVFGEPTTLIDGSDELCIDGNLQMLPSAGGTWVSSDTTIATITNGGLVTGISEGEVEFTFTDNNTGCVSDASDLVFVRPTPEVAVNGLDEICVGGSTNMVPSTGGVWMSTDPSIATIDNNGLVTGVSDGSVRFIYTQLSTGCSSDTSAAIQVNNPLVPEFLGDEEICQGDTTYISPSSGGQWESMNEDVATINSAGMIIGVGQGTVKFQFTESVSGCTSELSSSLTVNGPPSISNQGSAQVCIGSETQLSPSTGGQWVSLNPSIATVSANGLVTGLSAGNANFSFTDGNTGCVSANVITVAILDGTATFIDGSAEICAGYTTNLSPSIGGIWSSNNPEIASVSSNGLVTGKVAGKVTFTFVDAFTGCITESLDTITVSNCKNHDFNVALGGQLISGNLNTNDNLPLGVTYSNNHILVEKPLGSMGQLTISSEGSYTFSGSLAGDYIYQVPVCGNGQSSGCPTTLLEITVLDDVFSNGNMSTNLDIATTFNNIDPSQAGVTIQLNAMSNDKCVYTGGCDVQNVITVLDSPSNGSVTTDTLGNINYTPNAGFIGYDTIAYEICSLDGSDCNKSMQILSISDHSADNSVVASDDFNFTIAGSAVSGNLMSNDSDPEGDVISITPQGTVMAPIITSDGSYFIDSDGEYTFTPEDGFSGNTEIVYTVCDDNSNSSCTNATLHLMVFDDINLSIRIYIEGALMNNNDEIGSDGRPLMRDGLRNTTYDGKNYIPLSDPYTVPFNFLFDLAPFYSHLGPHLLEENQTIADSSAVFGVTGENAIVDWVHVELRSKDDYHLAIASRSGLLQRDGDVVDLDGVSPLRFQGVNLDSFYVVTKHRSHLGVMSQKVSRTTFVDFTSYDFPVFDFGANYIDGYNFSGLSMKSGVVPGYRACWAGDIDSNGRIKFSAPEDDQRFIFQDVLFSSPNFLINYDAAIGYNLGDYDLDGRSKFTNPSDDTNHLFAQILFYPINSNLISNFNLAIEQVPTRSN